MRASNLKVIAGLDFSAAPADDAKALSEARKRARPVLREWQRRVELAIMAGELSPTDYLMAKELCNYPSANEGRCYAGQERLGEAIGSSARTARASLARLRDRGFLTCKRGGPGKTASWTFCVNGKPIFGGAAFLPNPFEPVANDRQVSAQDRKVASGLDRKDVSAKPYELEPIERDPFPPSPQGAASGASQGPPKEASPTDAALHGEITVGEISFQEFWLAAGRQGIEGVARAEWRKLSVADKAAIADRVRRDGGLDLRKIWASTWLRDRVWEEPPLPPVEIEVGRLVTVHTEPGSELWRAERERLRALGGVRSIKFMDHLAAAGKGWTIQCQKAERSR